MLVKPSSLCNLRCKYCFYSGSFNERALRGNGQMTEETLETVVKEAFSTSAKHVVFAFQGGEPTMAGLSFFKRFSELETKYRPRRITVDRSIQTNGTLVDEKWADYFYENDFLVGISLDGNKALHNMNRVDSAGADTFNKVTAALEVLKRKKVSTNILCVVTGQLSRRAQAIYGQLKNSGYRYLQFIPCLDPSEQERGKETYSLTPARYAFFLKTLFDQWYNDWEKGDYVSIRVFDDYVNTLAGLPSSSCATLGTCGSYFAVESDGAVYPCDFYTVDKWRIGMIGEKPLKEIARSEKAKAFIKESTENLDKCSGCKYYRICRGGCRRDRYRMDGVLNNYYCPAFIDFFDYAMERLKIMASIERKLYRQQANTTPV